MTVRIRFELARGRHRPNVKDPREAQDRWRGRAIGAHGLKRHIGMVGHVVDPDEVPVFMLAAETVLRDMGGSDREVEQALDYARFFLNAHLPKRRAPAAQVAALATAVLARRDPESSVDREPASEGSGSVQPE